MTEQEIIKLIDNRVQLLQLDLISLIDDRVDMKTDIIMESDWFQEQVEIAVKLYLLEKEAMSNNNER